MAGSSACSIALDLDAVSQAVQAAAGRVGTGRNRSYTSTGW